MIEKDVTWMIIRLKCGPLIIVLPRGRKRRGQTAVASALADPLQGGQPPQGLKEPNQILFFHEVARNFCMTRKLCGQKDDNVSSWGWASRNS